jgi:hypothetical protein
MKAAFRHILLAALLLRALVPLGWMPGTAQLGQAAFIICNADGGVQHGIPGKQDANTHQQACAFAAAAKLFDSPAAASIAPPSSILLEIAGAVVPASPLAAAVHAPQAPRAPPAIA